MRRDLAPRLDALARAAVILALLGAAAIRSWGEADPQQSKKRAEPQSSSPADCRIEGSSVELPALSEASGIAASRRTPGVFWSHVDASSVAPVLFALDAHGSVKGKVRVDGAQVQDWEDVAAGPCGSSSCLFLGDIGDNKPSRASVTVYRVPEPLPGDGATKPAEAFHATYPEGPQDAEALFVSATGDVFIVTKGDSGPIALYRFPSPLRPGATVRLEKVATLQAGRPSKAQWITGASASPDGWVALRTHQAVFFYDARRIAKGDLGVPLVFDVTKLAEPQGEGVAFGPDGAVFLVSEGGRKGAAGRLGAAVCKLEATVAGAR